jgi:hypothetical protein
MAGLGETFGNLWAPLAIRLRHITMYVAICPLLVTISVYIGVQPGVSKGVEDGCRLPVLLVDHP